MPDALVQKLESFGHLAKHLAEEAAQLGFSVIEYERHLTAQRCDTFGHHDSALAKQTTDFVGQSRAPLDELEANAMERLYVLLGCALDRYEPHRGPSDRLADCVGVVTVILLPLTVWRHEVWARQPRRLAEVFDLA